jgi:hypothetical protein
VFAVFSDGLQNFDFKITATHVCNEPFLSAGSYIAVNKIWANINFPIFVLFNLFLLLILISVMSYLISHWSKNSLTFCEQKLIPFSKNGFILSKG